MGQGQSITETVIPETVDAVHMEVVRHAKVLSEINALSYEDFKSCLENLNTLYVMKKKYIQYKSLCTGEMHSVYRFKLFFLLSSRKCIDPNGKQLVFLVKKGTDTSMLWKATVKIACIKVNPVTRHIDSYKFLNLKQFLCVFKTFQSHLDSLVSSENQMVWCD